MIEKVSNADYYMATIVAAKLNELIDAYNKLEQKYEDHFHKYDDSTTLGPSND